MKSILLLTVPAMMATVPVMACLNGSHAIERVVLPKMPVIPSDSSKLILPNESLKVEVPAFNPLTLPAVSTGLSAEQKESFAKLARDFKSGDPSDASFEQRTDYAIALIYLGRYVDAVRELLGVEKSKPGSYITASALGTAYELNGDLRNARLWIAEGIKRDASSHAGTEWLHIDIINAKIKLAADAKWLVRNAAIQGRDGKTAAEVLTAIE